MAAGRPPDPLNHLVPAPSPLPMGATPTPNSQQPQPQGCLETLQTQIQPPSSPRSQKKSFLSIVSGEKPPVVPITRTPFVYKDKPAAAFFEDEIQTLAQPFKLSLVGKFSRMPKLQDIRLAFKGIGLSGAYEVRWLDYKHVLIHLSSEQDFNRIWAKQVWFIVGQKMRVFKWTPEFEPEKESTVVPVWISFPNLKAHLFEKSALLLIAKTVGKPLFLDEATANGSRPSVARVCIEYDCRKPPMNQVWIVVQNRETGTVTSGYPQKVDFAQMPAYCDHCCHVGHKEVDCIVLGNKEKPSSLGKLQTARVGVTEKTKGDEGANGKVLEKRNNLETRKNPEKEKTRSLDEPANLRWQPVGKAGTSGVKDQQGKEISAEQTLKDANILASNCFYVISGDGEEVQDQVAEQGLAECVIAEKEGALDVLPVADQQHGGTVKTRERKNATRIGNENHRESDEQMNAMEKTEGSVVRSSDPGKDQQNRVARNNVSEVQQISPDATQANGKPQKEVRDQRREGTEKQRTDTGGRNGNGTSRRAETVVALSAKSQLLEDGAELILHENSMHVQKENSKGDRERTENMGSDSQIGIVERRSKEADRSNKKEKNTPKETCHAAEQSWQGKEKQIIKNSIERAQRAMPVTAGSDVPRGAAILQGQRDPSSQLMSQGGATPEASGETNEALKQHQTALGQPDGTLEQAFVSTGPTHVENDNPRSPTKQQLGTKNTCLSPQQRNPTKARLLGAGKQHSKNINLNSHCELNGAENVAAFATDSQVSGGDAQRQFHVLGEHESQATGECDTTGCNRNYKNKKKHQKLTEVGTEPFHEHGIHGQFQKAKALSEATTKGERERPETSATVAGGRPELMDVTTPATGCGQEDLKNGEMGGQQILSGEDAGETKMAKRTKKEKVETAALHGPVQRLPGSECQHGQEAATDQLIGAQHANGCDQLPDGTPAANKLHAHPPTNVISTLASKADLPDISTLAPDKSDKNNSKNGPTQRHERIAAVGKKKKIKVGLTQRHKRATTAGKLHANPPTSLSDQRDPVTGKLLNLTNQRDPPKNGTVQSNEELKHATVDGTWAHKSENKDQLSSENKSGCQNESMDNLEGSGEYSPIRGRDISQSKRLDGNIQTASPPLCPQERMANHTDHPPTQESASGKCTYNRELSDVPLDLETHFAEFEVHPRERRRRHSHDEASIRKILSIPSEDAVDMGENDEVSDDDSISTSYFAARTKFGTHDENF